MGGTIPRGGPGYHRPMTADTTAPGLLRSVGLMADGPGQWAHPVPASGPGIFIVELAAPLSAAPIELTRVGKWIERVDTLRLDGERPTSKALAARLASFWLPSQTVIYIGTSEASVRRRLAAIAATELGDRRPYAGGHWLKTLRTLDAVRIWWAGTTATEEYEDALFDAFAESVTAAERAGLHDPEVVLPFANLRRASGGRKATGLTRFAAGRAGRGSGAADPGRERPRRRRGRCQWRAAAATPTARQAAAGHVRGPRRSRGRRRP